MNIQEPKPDWTWYDYKLACVNTLWSAKLRLSVGDKDIRVRKMSDSTEVFTCPKRVGWKNFYEVYLKGLVDKHEQH